MERCLYGPDGFYTTGRGTAGRRGGDFITSPEVGPLFGAVLARAVDRWWYELGQPDPYLVVDVGAGPGRLVRSLEAAAPSCAEAWRLESIDRAAGSALPSDLDGAVVVANELLDNLPVRILERRTDGWAELYVVDGHEELVPAVEPPDELPGNIAVGQRIPLIEQASDWVRSLLDRSLGRLVVFDYGARTTAELAARGDFIRTYRQHRVGTDPLREPGGWDITTDVPVDQLPLPARVETQAEFLRRWGIDELVAEGRARWTEQAARPDVAALRMRSRVTEAEALLDPSGLGSWLALTWGS